MNKKEIIERLKSIKPISEHIMNEKIDFFEVELEEAGYTELTYNAEELSEYLGFLANEVEKASDVFLTIRNIIKENDINEILKKNRAFIKKQNLPLLKDRFAFMKKQNLPLRRNAMNIKNSLELSEIVKELLNLPEYKRKQLALILIGSTLTDLSKKEAETVTECFI